MKNLESFFELSNYDSKNITNKGGNKVINQEALNTIESQGVTLEFLENLSVPVFKYRTQITLHGIFPELKKNYLGGYKNLFQNKNLSIGVKWQAVDFAKKDRIYKAITGYLAGWRRRHTSTDFFIYKTSEIFRDKETYKNMLDAAKAEISHINKSLFFGNCGVYLSQTPWVGYFLVTYINVGAILEKNVIPCIENITKVSMETIEAAAAEKRAKMEAEQAKRKAEHEADMKARAEKKAPIMEAARQLLINAGYRLVLNEPIEINRSYIKIETDTDTGKFNFVAYKYSKEPRQKKFRYVKATSPDLNFVFGSREYDKRETVHTTASGWIRVIDIPQQAAKEESKPTPAKTVILVNYSDKAIALFGDTKPLKEQIKAIGGRFNPFLNNNGIKQAGWILPAQKIEQAKALIK